MLKTILSISGKPGLYKLISQGKNMLIVESINADKKRFPAYGNEKIISLADIAMYTDDAEVPLYDVLKAMKKKENSAIASLDPKKAIPEQLREYLAEVLPNFDRDHDETNQERRVHAARRSRMRGADPGTGRPLGRRCHPRQRRHRTVRRDSRCRLFDLLDDLPDPGPQRVGPRTSRLPAADLPDHPALPGRGGAAVGRAARGFL